MALVDYKTNFENKSLTKCPYGRKEKETNFMVGAYGSGNAKLNCQSCKYFNTHLFQKQTDDGTEGYVSCNYAEDVASRNKKPQKQKSEKVINPVKFKCICGHNKYTGLYIERTNPRTRTEVVSCNKCNKAYKLEFTLTNQIVPYKQGRNHERT